MLESIYQGKLIKKIYGLWPGSIVLKNDTSYIQGISDLTILFDNGMWALLEVKAYENAPIRPNQPFYVELAKGMSFGAFIYPENEEEVLRELQLAYEQSNRHARVS